MAARWNGSADDRAWREGLVALEELPSGREWDRVPAWASLSAHNGVWEPATDLPADSPARTRLRWPDGSALDVPLVSAASAYASFSRPAAFIEEECPAKGCRPLRVTGAELGEAPLNTSRGTIRVPAWMFTVKGVKQKYVHVALAPSAVTAPPKGVEGDTEEVTAYDLVAGRPKDVLLKYGHGSCDRIHGTRAYETDRLVVVDVDEEMSGGWCNLMLKIGTIPVTLTRPLGDRLVLDSGTGLPVARGLTRR
ncbi:hypothetical protein [Nonomuraea sp. NPDC050405]|uniref:hypothetical protein n=1 Tax=Nonomuraea sp. NPDC050405 TaxID=3154509 RepID=UPI003402A64F